MTDFIGEAAALVRGMDAAIPAQDRDTCAHCGEGLVFKPFFLDGKQPNPPVWFHDGSGRTCRTRPKGWRKQSWPCAVPSRDRS